MNTADQKRLLATLSGSDERFHGWAEDVREQWKLDAPSLELIMQHVSEGDRTLETGCGYSTVIFAAVHAQHLSISPFAVEHDRIRKFCEEHAVPLDRVSFLEGFSQDELPNLRPDPLDFVLIDGSHAFPIPFIDWYYACLGLRVGGLLMVDDTHIRTGEILRDFLEAENDRWRLVTELPSLALFRRIGEPLLPPWDWPGQPYLAKPRRVRGMGPTRWQELRMRVRIRTRIRAVSDRLRR